MTEVKTKIETLKHHVGEIHRMAEQTAFSRRLVQGAILKSHYLTYLRALSIIHGVLETRIQKSDSRLIGSIWRDEMRKLPLLEADISVFESGQMADEPTAVSIALECTAQIRAHSLGSPANLIGCLYVLEGSTNGGRLLYKRIQEALKLPDGKGTAYFRNYGDAQPHAWNDFKDRVESNLPPEHLDAACQGARELFTYMVDILKALDPSSADPARMRVHATAFNPEAGSHGVVQDDREIEAVIRAGESCLKKMPYIGMRFGKRGARFTKSDGAWLATLVNFSPATMLSQVDWLANILCPLGMPRYALEVHLRESENLLIALNPGLSEKYRKLSIPADALRDKRNEVIPQADQDELVNRFLSGIQFMEGPCHDALFARLVISFVVDEVLGPPGGLEKTKSWMQNEFPGGEQVRLGALELMEKAAGYCGNTNS